MVAAISTTTEPPRAGLLAVALVLLTLASSALAASARPSLERDIRTQTLARTEHPAADLERDSRLRAIARDHSAAMYRQQTLGHVLEDGVGPSERVAREHRSLFALISENVAYQQHWPSGADLAERFVQSWMDSPGHRRNILAPYEIFEVGCHGDRTTMFCTQLFARATARSLGGIPFRQAPGSTLTVRVPGARLSVAPAGTRPEGTGVAIEDRGAQLGLPHAPGLYELHLWTLEPGQTSRYAIVGGPYLCVTRRRETVSDCGM